MEGLSPLHTQLLLRKPNRRFITSSDEDDISSRPMEEQDATVQYHASKPSKHQDTPCGCSTQSGSNIGSPPVEQECNETVITFVYHNEDSWESDDDSTTSTPGYKRGRHANEHPVEPSVAKARKRSKSSVEKRDPDQELTNTAIQEILQQGMKFCTVGWVHKRGERAPSVVILADSQLQNWPAKDRVLCRASSVALQVLDAGN